MKPSQTWPEIKEEKTTIAELYTSYVVILAAIPAVAQLIGYGLIGHSVLGVHFRWGIGRALGHAILFYALTLVSIYIVALIADALAPSFGSKKNILNAFKAVVYSMTPSLVGGIFGYLVVVIVISIVVYLVIGAIVGALFSPRML